jgi:CopG family nickel-responsive transcriptional regulator
MKRITMTVDDDLLAAVDAHMDASGATNRSEAMRDLIARALASDAPDDAPCLGVVSYTVEPDMRDLARKIPQVRQDNHDRFTAALSVPVDHGTSLEVAVLKGRVAEVTSIANALFLERGVRHGRLALVPVAIEDHSHAHGNGAPHRHARVINRFE